jgi:hypothetical protein
VLDQKHLMELLQRIKKVNKSEGYDRWKLKCNYNL